MLQATGGDRAGPVESIYIPTGPKLGDVVVKAEGVAKYVGGRCVALGAVPVRT